MSQPLKTLTTSILKKQLKEAMAFKNQELSLDKILKRRRVDACSDSPDCTCEKCDRETKRKLSQGFGVEAGEGYSLKRTIYTSLCALAIIGMSVLGNLGVLERSWEFYKSQFRSAQNSIAPSYESRTSYKDQQNNKVTNLNGLKETSGNNLKGLAKD